MQVHYLDTILKTLVQSRVQLINGEIKMKIARFLFLQILINENWNFKKVGFLIKLH